MLPCGPGFEPLVGRFCLFLSVLLLAFRLVGWEMIGSYAQAVETSAVFLNFIVVSLLGGVWLKNWFRVFLLLPVRF